MNSFAAGQPEQRYKIALSDTGGYKFSPATCDLSYSTPCRFKVNGRYNKQTKHVITLANTSLTPHFSPLQWHTTPYDIRPFITMHLNQYLVMYSSNRKRLYFIDVGQHRLKAIVTGKLILPVGYSTYSIPATPHIAILSYNTLKLLNADGTTHTTVKLPLGTQSIRRAVISSSGQIAIVYQNVVQMIKADGSMGANIPIPVHSFVKYIRASISGQMAISFSNNVVQIIKADGSKGARVVTPVTRHFIWPTSATSRLVHLG